MKILTQEIIDGCEVNGHDITDLLCTCFNATGASIQEANYPNGRVFAWIDRAGESRWLTDEEISDFVERVESGAL